MPTDRPTLIQEIDNITQAYDEELQVLRARYLGKAGKLDGLLQGLRDLEPEDRRIIGEVINLRVRHIKGG